jgi:hypothetical protein
MGPRCDIQVLAAGSCRLECLARVRELGDELLLEDDVRVLTPAGQVLVSDRTRGNLLAPILAAGYLEACISPIDKMLSMRLL